MKALVAVSALLIVAASIVGGRAAEVLFTVLAGAFPFALMAIGAARGGRRGIASATILALLVLVEGSLLVMLFYRGRVLEAPWLGGLPATAAALVYGIFLLPLAVTVLGFALAFRDFGVGERDLERLRRAAARRGDR